MSKSIYFRNFLTTAVLVLGSFFLIVGVMFFIGRSYLEGTVRDSLNENAEEVVRMANAVSRQSSLDSWVMRMTISSIASGTGRHIVIADADGLVVSCSDSSPTCPHIGMKIADSIVSELRTEGKYEERSSLNGFYSSSRYVAAKPIVVIGETIGYAFVSTDEVMPDWSTFISMAIIIGLFVMLITVCMSYVYSKKMAEPLDEMALAAKKFAHGEFSVRVGTDEQRDDEVGALQAAFNNMADSLEKSEASRREFIANVSHELRTPMTTISGFADGMVDGTIPPELHERYLRKIADETRRLSRLVRSMLDLSHAESKAREKARRSKFDLGELMVQTLLSLETRATEKSLDVDLQIPEDPIFVLANADSITQVLYNLIDNAVKFAKVGSTLTLRLYKYNRKAYAAVRNIGEPIPPEDLPFIFERFHKSDRSRSLDKDGVGLGLYLVKTILNSHDEDIAVTSREGVTEFTFTLPLVTEKENR